MVVNSEKNRKKKEEKGKEGQIKAINDWKSGKIIIR